MHTTQAIDEKRGYSLFKWTVDQHSHKGSDISPIFVHLHNINPIFKFQQPGGIRAWLIRQPSTMFREVDWGLIGKI